MQYKIGLSEVFGCECVIKGSKKSHRLHGERAKEWKLISGRQNGAVIEVRGRKQFQCSVFDIHERRNWGADLYL